MAKPFIWTPKLDALLHTMAAQVPPVPISEQARRVGTSRSTVDRRRRHLGISADTTATIAATQTKRATSAERRAKLEHRHLDRIEAILDRLEAPTFTTVFRGEGGAEHEHNVRHVPPRDEKELAASITQHWGALERIHRMNPDNGNTDAVSMLGGIAKLLTQAAASMPEDGPQA